MYNIIPCIVVYSVSNLFCLYTCSHTFVYRHIIILLICATRLSFTEVMSIPELRENPFRLRICEVFASSGRGIGFEDFLDLCSVFSEGLQSLTD